MFTYFRRRKEAALASAKIKIKGLVDFGILDLVRKRQTGLYRDEHGNVQGREWNEHCQQFFNTVVRRNLTNLEVRAVLDAGLSELADELVESPVRAASMHVAPVPRVHTQDDDAPNLALRIGPRSAPQRLPSHHPHELDTGLIIRSEPLSKILAGLKTWEMRSRRIKKRGAIGLIAKGSKAVSGVAEIVDCIGPLSDSQIVSGEHFHGVSPDRISELLASNYRYAWVLAHVRTLARPVPYIHKGGVQFVTLDHLARDDIRQALNADA